MWYPRRWAARVATITTLTPPFAGCGTDWPMAVAFVATALAGSLMSDAQPLLRGHKTEKFLNPVRLFATQPDLDQLPGVDPPEVGIGKQALIFLGSAYDQLDPRPAA